MKTKSVCFWIGWIVTFPLRAVPAFFVAALFAIFAAGIPELWDDMRKDLRDKTTPL